MWGKPPEIGEFPSQRASNAESISMSWCLMEVQNITGYFYFIPLLLFPDDPVEIYFHKHGLDSIQNAGHPTGMDNTGQYFYFLGIQIKNSHPGPMSCWQLQWLQFPLTGGLTKTLDIVSVNKSSLISLYTGCIWVKNLSLVPYHQYGHQQVTETPFHIAQWYKSPKSVPSVLLLKGFHMNRRDSVSFMSREQLDSCFMSPKSQRACESWIGFFFLAIFLSVEECIYRCSSVQLDALTHLLLEKMAAILQTIFWDAFSWMKSFVFWLKFHLS